MATKINGQKHVNSSMYTQYAGHLTDFYNYMKGNGVDVYAVSIQNEPDYANDWTCRGVQNASRHTNVAIAIGLGTIMFLFRSKTACSGNSPK
jgi:O-glycosyl hydrolase